MTLRSPRVRIIGHGNHLRLRTLGDWEANPIEALRECCRAETALEKAMWQTVKRHERRATAGLRSETRSA